ncbi:MAG: tRNA (adenosine(37)-N6)-threonylcarbamoyltransferase complex ATPase subunit type 1 TsaE [Deltaproteobacteria bacterium]|nr:tRNA (adenosine(37)-N6)-threonylcarbamoyltransferase complex ATPase subunit type 1 TsaE [Deltaproteobacteria bacterium]
MILPDEAATRAAGARLAAVLRGGEAIALVGELGAGKTTFVAGLVEALGGGPASSPTFSLLNEYPGGRLIVWHCDLYRIERDRELAELGLDDVIGDPRGVVIVEWADKFAVLPADHTRIELRHADGARELVASGPLSATFP